MKIICSKGQTSISVDDVPRAVRRLIDLCETIPEGEGWSTRRCADALDYTHPTLSAVTAHPLLFDYRISLNNTYYWGTKKTIKKEIAALAKTTGC